MPQCSFHPDVETNLACGKCGRYICPRDVIHTPVGARCRQCARLQRLPTFDVKARHYLVAVLAGLGTALALGVAWGFLFSVVRFSLLSWVIAVAVGYLVGEAISLSVNRKRGTGLAVIAGASMLVAFVTSGFISTSSIRFLLNDIVGLIILAVALMVAANRVR